MYWAVFATLSTDADNSSEAWSPAPVKPRTELWIRTLATVIVFTAVYASLIRYVLTLI